MMTLPLAKVSVFMSILAGIWVLIAVTMILLILVQKGKGGGIGAAFGGMGAGSLLGTKTGDFFTWVTIALVILFLSLGVVLAKFHRPGVDTELQRQAAPMTAPQEGDMDAVTTEPTTGMDAIDEDGEEAAAPLPEETPAEQE